MLRFRALVQLGERCGNWHPLADGVLLEAASGTSEKQPLLRVRSGWLLPWVTGVLCQLHCRIIDLLWKIVLEQEKIEMVEDWVTECGWCKRWAG